MRNTHECNIHSKSYKVITVLLMGMLTAIHPRPKDAF